MTPIRPTKEQVEDWYLQAPAAKRGETVTEAFARKTEYACLQATASALEQAASKLNEMRLAAGNEMFKEAYRHAAEAIRSLITTQRQSAQEEQKS